MSYQLLSKTRPTGNKSPSALIHILDNDSLLGIFSLCRPVILDESEVDSDQILEGGKWNGEHWWCRLVQVCRRWRYLVLESPSHLCLSLVCSRGTPVAEMLVHSPPLPLAIDHLVDYRNITAKDEMGIILALQHRDRMRRIRLRMSVPILQKLIIALDGEFPILEYLYIMPIVEHNMSLNLPESFRAPHLRHLVVKNFAIPIGSPLFATMGNLVTLSLNLIPPSAYFHPDALLQRLSFMPQLETLGIAFISYSPSRDVEGQLSRTPIVTRVTLPNLRRLAFRGANAYLEALLSQVTIPLLEKIEISFFNELTYSIPHLQECMSTAGNFRPKTITLTFCENYLYVMAYSHKGARMYAWSMSFGGRYLDRQLASTAQVFHMLRTVFSAVEDLSLELQDVGGLISSANRTPWRELLGSFGNVKTLRVDYRLVKQLSCALRPGEGELLTEPLPELQELQELPHFSTLTSKSFTLFGLFIDARQKAGRSVTLIHP
jgi:hypothetical protein